MNQATLAEFLRAHAGAQGPGSRVLRVGGPLGFLLLLLVAAFSFVVLAGLGVVLALRGVLRALFGVFRGPARPRVTRSAAAPTVTVEDAEGRVVATVER